MRIKPLPWITQSVTHQKFVRIISNFSKHEMRINLAAKNYPRDHIHTHTPTPTPTKKVSWQWQSLFLICLFWFASLYSVICDANDIKSILENTQFSMAANSIKKKQKKNSNLVWLHRNRCHWGIEKLAKNKHLISVLSMRFDSIWIC